LKLLEIQQRLSGYFQRHHTRFSRKSAPLCADVAKLTLRPNTGISSALQNSIPQKR